MEAERRNLDALVPEGFKNRGAFVHFAFTFIKGYLNHERISILDRERD
jgi:hypothetical protein